MKKVFRFCVLRTFQVCYFIITNCSANIKGKKPIRLQTKKIWNAILSFYWIQLFKWLLPAFKQNNIKFRKLSWYDPIVQHRKISLKNEKLATILHFSIAVLDYVLYFLTFLIYSRNLQINRSLPTIFILLSSESNRKEFEEHFHWFVVIDLA